MTLLTMLFILASFHYIATLGSLTNYLQSRGLLSKLAREHRPLPNLIEFLQHTVYTTVYVTAMPEIPSIVLETPPETPSMELITHSATRPPVMRWVMTPSDVVFSPENPSLLFDLIFLGYAPYKDLGICKKVKCQRVVKIAKDILTNL
ncbi:hypothetical protein M422DRAFT_48481 [Sphaerobolus stellatus SS14]|uniref:Uncharacterized protein n=1 Tax=Sphaerobolus stellatus (strain SS14) TaxID=990650 RepID=A0A0C9VJJ3_SPHS4|nr:hypothetical protein M422DRAFT_48481 [Sphaerobolus stellatus SS14]